MKRLLALLAGAAVLAGCGEDEERSSPAPAPPRAQTSQDTQADRPPERSEGEPRVHTIADGLDVPWDLAFLPDGRALVTERPGRVRLLGADGKLGSAPVAQVDVDDAGEGGLL
ncbi:MAG TPA: PQQ-dependent sugar dehydrogenase, partial [Thermoanaerobaculia bacterium]|nr:PQQ-dependent sugar dehydrogenase [Thermoanaerobaculia bacterium]